MRVLRHGWHMNVWVKDWFIIIAFILGMVVEETRCSVQIP